MFLNSVNAKIPSTANPSALFLSVESTASREQESYGEFVSFFKNWACTSWPLLNIWYNGESNTLNKRIQNILCAENIIINSIHSSSSILRPTPVLPLRSFPDLDNLSFGAARTICAMEGATAALASAPFLAGRDFVWLAGCACNCKYGRRSRWKAAQGWWALAAGSASKNWDVSGHSQSGSAAQTLMIRRVWPSKHESNASDFITCEGGCDQEGERRVVRWPKELVLPITLPPRLSLCPGALCPKLLPTGWGSTLHSRKETCYIVHLLVADFICLCLCLSPYVRRRPLANRRRCLSKSSKKNPQMLKKWLGSNFSSFTWPVEPCSILSILLFYYIQQ